MIQLYQIFLRLLRLFHRWIFPCDTILPIYPYVTTCRSECKTNTSDMLSLSRSVSAETPESWLCLVITAIQYSFVSFETPYPAKILPSDNVMLHYQQEY